MLNRLMYANDTVLVAELEESLQNMARDFREVCWRNKFLVNVSNGKVMVLPKNGGADMDV